MNELTILKRARMASKQVIRDFCTDCKVPLSRLLINTVDSNIPPFDTWYIIPLAYEPFWEGGKEYEEI